MIDENGDELEVWVPRPASGAELAAWEPATPGTALNNGDSIIFPDVILDVAPGEPLVVRIRRAE